MKKQCVNNYYFVVQGWMVEELRLRGCELSLFAIIYGFSQGLNSCDVSLNYLSALTGFDKTWVVKCLHSLEAKQYISVIQNKMICTNKKQRNTYQTLVCPSSSVKPLFSSSHTPLQTEIIDFLKNNLKINNINNKNQLRQFKLDICREIDEYEKNLQTIAKAKWLDD